MADRKYPLRPILLFLLAALVPGSLHFEPQTTAASPEQAGKITATPGSNRGQEIPPGPGRSSPTQGVAPGAAGRFSAEETSSPYELGLGELSLEEIEAQHRASLKAAGVSADDIEILVKQLSQTLRERREQLRQPVIPPTAPR